MIVRECKFQTRTRVPKFMKSRRYDIKREGEGTADIAIKAYSPVIVNNTDGGRE